MSLINLVPEGFAWSLGWTLIHTLWQAALLWLIVTFAGWLINGKASIRYLFYCAALVSQLIFTIITLSLIYEPIVTASGLNGFLTDFSPIALPSQQDSMSSFLQLFITQLDGHMNWLISVWLIGVFILTIRFIGGMIYIQFLQAKFRSVSDDWGRKLTSISERIGIKQLVRLGESIYINRPIVVGIIKPMILLPIGLLSHLPVEQVEAILMHELSHIKRHDYLVNMIQSIIEVLLFFNPFIWIISNKIREEREHCCDDYAIQAGTNRLDYVRALANAQAFQASATPSLALAFGKNEFQVLNRIKRIMEKSVNPKPNKLTPASILILLIVGVACVAWMTPDSTEKKAENKGIISTEVVLPQDTSGTKDKLDNVQSGRYSKKVITTYDENGYVQEEVIEEYDGDEALKPFLTDPGSLSFAMPAIPNLPNLPSIPNPPLHGFTYSFDNDSIPHFRHFSDEDIKQWEEFGEEMAERFKEFEFDNEEFAHRMDIWADRFEHDFNFNFEKFDEDLQNNLDVLHERLKDLNEGDLHERLNESLHQMEKNLERLDDRLKEHEGEFRDFERKMKDYENELQAQLINDGYLKPGEKIESINWTGKRLTVNGVTIKDEDLPKYEAINKKYFNGSKGYYFKN